MHLSSSVLVHALALFSAFATKGALARPQAQSLTRRATVCNGHAELCSRSFGNVTFVGAHDSYAVGVDNLAVNQDYDVTQQLTDGIRMLQVQAHLSSGDIRLCHTSCILYDGGTLQDYLTKVKTWMVANPNEVVSLLIVNIDNQAPTAFDTIFKAAGVDTMSFAPSTGTLTADSWPTLGALIDAGTRLLTFLDNAANPSAVPYLIDEFTNIWETPFDVTGTFDCSVNRTKGDPTTQMYLINHFLDTLILGQPVPFVAQADLTNAATGTNSLGAQVDVCLASNPRPPNFMLVDFYEFGGGSVFQVAADLNGVTYAPTTPIVTPRSSVSASPSSTSSGGNSTSTPDQKNAGMVSKSISILTVLSGLALGPYLIL